MTIVRWRGLGLLVLLAGGCPVFGLYVDAPNPLGNEHLVIVRPDAFQNAAGSNVATVVEEGAVFDGRAAPVAGPVTAPLAIRHPGRYTLWVRAGQKAGGRSALNAELARDGHVIAGGALRADDGSPLTGGPAGYAAYVKEAMKYAPAGAAVNDAGVAAEYHQQQIAGGQKETATEDLGEQLADQLISELRKPSGAIWVNIQRIDPKTSAGFYWWKIAAADLPAGACQLRIAPAEPAGGALPLVDAAFLTTCTNLIYPCARDIAAPRASYIRFRIDKLPKAGLTIAGYVTTYIIPYMGTGLVNFNPSGGISAKRQERYTQAGYTPWFCLQDIEHMTSLAWTRPGFFTLQLDGKQVLPKGVAGATQFAAFPFQDAVALEVPWQEPSGFNVTMVNDYDAYPELLRTFRDQAREHYEQALQASTAQIFPLTRMGLYLETGGGGPDDVLDYVVKSLRLMGFNDTYTPDPVAVRQRYGWASFSGNAGWPCRSLPFDEEATRRIYVAHYKDLQDPAWREFNAGVPVFQMVDEPYEMLCSEMTAPLWRYEAPTGQPPRWVDYPGSSELYTRSVTYSNCVLEGAVEKRGGLIEFRVATDNPTNPARFAYWQIGTVLPDNAPENLMVGKRGMDENRRQAFINPVAGAITEKPARFKIVYERDKAALYLNGSLVSQQDQLPSPGGFGFAGDAKAVAGLRFRRLEANEHIIPPGFENRAPGETETKSQDVDNFLNEMVSALESAPDKLAAWERPKPLKEFVEQEWVVGGGMPEAHAGFRRWAAAQGATPALFGKKAWDEVPMLTLTNLVQSPEDARLFYWSRRYSGYLTPRMFALAMDGIRANAPNKQMMSYVGLSCGNLVFSDCTPMDMFQLASYTNGLMPGISDWFAYSTESPQGDAFSAAFFNAGARRYGRLPGTIGMMHCVRPSVFRTYTVLANNMKYISFYNYGPQFANGDNWSECHWCYDGSALINNRVTQADDLAIGGQMRPSRVALLYSMANEYWGHGTSFKDKRSGFLALSHEYFQPEMVNEDQVAGDALSHYDALYVMDEVVAAAAQKQIESWVRNGGLLWLDANAATRNEFDEPDDLLLRLTGARRTFAAPAAASATAPLRLVVSPVKGDTAFRPHGIVSNDLPSHVAWEGARIRAVYNDGRPAWLEGAAGKGRVVYVAHRAGLTYGARVIRYFNMGDLGEENYWADTGRVLLTQPLHERKIERELVLSEPLYMASALTTPGGSLIVLYNMRPGPTTNLEFRLKEPTAPRRVDIFEGFRQVALPCEYRDGWLIGKLPPFTGGQMVIVRRQDAPADDRLAQLQNSVTAQMASTNGATLSAGAFFAGFFPEWKLGDRLPALLAHPQWEVRRQAAESLGRLHATNAAPAIAAALAKETDAHALGDELYALAVLQYPQTQTLCLDLVKHPNWFVRRQALRAASRLLFGEAGKAAGNGWLAADQDKARVFGMQMIDAALQETDQRIRGEAIRMLGRLDVRETLQRAVAAALANQRDLAIWAEAVAANDAVFNDYLNQNRPGGDNLLLALAKVRRHPALAQALSDRLPALVITAQNTAKLVDALAFQRDQKLARKLCLERKTIPAPLVQYLAYILNYAFDARLGSDLDDWEAWLREKAEP